MNYINKMPNENGNYGNPHSNFHEGEIGLPDSLLPAYLESNGFVNVEVDNNNIATQVTRNVEAYEAYQRSLPPPYVPTPAEQREQAYNSLEIVEVGDSKITVTAAAQLWQYYAAEGNPIADELQEKIAAAKAHIREMYPDEN